ncbi:MAG: helix-turn-helix domain-containing protein [Phycisphaeraceae bacterium]|nr:helix-turn-helix domain-containing protein [Phycisphaeraceae bacterium]
MQCLRNVLEYQHADYPARRHLASLALEQALVLAFSLTESRIAMDDRIERAIAAMRRDPSHPWREAALARVASLSASRFAHLFRAQVGISPVRFLEQVRMEKAKGLLLATSQPIKSIAAEVGYDDALHFSTRFRRATGRCPRTYRRAGAG